VISRALEIPLVHEAVDQVTTLKSFVSQYLVCMYVCIDGPESNSTMHIARLQTYAYVTTTYIFGF
jgi:hypothetical protein